MSPADFYELTVGEALLAIEQHRESEKMNYYLNYMAFYNAYGSATNKKFKPKHPFEEKKSKKIATKQERDETLAFLKELETEAGEL